MITYRQKMKIESDHLMFSGPSQQTRRRARGVHLCGRRRGLEDLIFSRRAAERAEEYAYQFSGSYNFFYFHDGNKNVSELVFFQQANGIAAHYEYAPFGAVTAATTNTAFTAFNAADINPYRFSSEYADDALGLVYYNYRHYNPVDGRWTGRDPYLPETICLMLYGYADNGLFAGDVLGLFPSWSDAKKLAGVIAKYSAQITEYAKILYNVAKNDSTIIIDGQILEKIKNEPGNLTGDFDNE